MPFRIAYYTKVLPNNKAANMNLDIRARIKNVHTDFALTAGMEVLIDGREVILRMLRSTKIHSELRCVTSRDLSFFMRREEGRTPKISKRPLSRFAGAKMSTAVFCAHMSS